ncbi:MAG: uracil phosphoribosyltransferase [Proteobacteria bacterium]|nr:uracil phosphoribosyltransferase [Pseudomonadota bacterium]MBI3499387.1 uracil phosphoribosyltransferase [Pseudomonadota bacterium]
MAEFSNLHVLDHPLIQHKLTLLRDQRTPKMLFRRVMREIALLMGYEITRPLPLDSTPIETPVAPTTGGVVHGNRVAVVSILRAGIGMAEGLLELIPTAREGHIGLYRDPMTKQPVEYLVKLPEPGRGLFLVVDPMLATGNSAVHALDVLNRHGVEDKAIRFLALVAAPEGMRTFNRSHPSVPVYAAALDERLNDHAYIVPGLGDAGDRLFGTK